MRDRSAIRFVLCASQAHLEHPEVLGLDQAGLDQAFWLMKISGAREARAWIPTLRKVNEVWVVSADHVEAINLAAALKRDAPALRVVLVALHDSGSIRSRAAAAGLDQVLSASEFAEHFRQAAQLCAAVAPPQVAGFHQVPSAALLGGHEVMPSLVPQADLTIEPVVEEVPLELYEQLQAFLGPDEASSLGEDSDGKKPRGAGFLLTVASGGGGVGKSTLSTLVAYEVAQRGVTCALLDADFRFGDLHELTKGLVKLRADEFLERPAALDEMEAPAGLPVLIAAPEHLEQAEQLEDRLAGLVGELQKRFDVVVVNTGSLWGETHAFLLERSMASLLLVDQRASSIRACRHGIDLALRCGIATSSFTVALNRCDRRAPFTSIDVSSALQGAHVFELADGGREVEELMNSGLTQDLLSTHNPLCTSIGALLLELIPGLPEAKKGSAGVQKTSLLSTVELGKSTEDEAARSPKAKRRRRKRTRRKSEGALA